MRFTLSDDAISRLRLDPDVKGRIFEGPRIERGLFSSFTTAEKRWARKAFFKGENLENVSQDELEPLYFYLAVRRENPMLLPERLFPDFAAADFEILPHEYLGELAACMECTMPVRASVHDVPEDTTTPY